MTMFKDINEVEPGSYKNTSSGTVSLAAGEEQSVCFLESTVVLEKLKIHHSVHVKDMNSTLASIEQICDQNL